MALAAIRSLESTLGVKPEAPEVVELLVHNQVPLLSLLQSHELRGDQNGLSPDDDPAVRRVLQSKAFASALATNQMVYDEVHGNFAIAARAWEARDVRSICFKSGGIAPSYPYTSENFDILFRPEDERKARAVLTELGYVLLANCDEPQKWLYRLFVAGRSVSAIHLHTRVGWGQGFMHEAGLWSRSRHSADDPLTWVPGPEDVVLINAAHAFFENKAFGLHDLMKIRQAISDGVEWDTADGVAHQRGWLSAFHFAMAIMGTLERRLFDTPLIPLERFHALGSKTDRSREQLERAETLPAEMPFFTSWKLVKIHFFDKIARDQGEPWSAKPSLVFLTLARGVKSQLDARPQNSGLFTLSGIDGSGKTRQAQGLADAFTVCHLRTKVMWARLGATPVMHRASRVWRDAEAAPTPVEANGSFLVNGDGQAGIGQSLAIHRQETERGSAVPRMIWALLSSADFSVWLLRLRWRLLRGDIVVADRFMCDFDVEMSMKLGAKPKFGSRLVKALNLIAPRPTRAYLLDVDPLHARERALPDGGDFDPETAIEMYRARAEKYGLAVVDARRAFEEVSSVVEREGLREYFNRYGMLTNFPFFMNPWQLNRPVRKQVPQETGSVQPVVAAHASAEDVSSAM